MPSMLDGQSNPNQNTGLPSNRGEWERLSGVQTLRGVHECVSVDNGSFGEGDAFSRIFQGPGYIFVL